MTRIIDDVQQPDSRTCQSAAIARVTGTTSVMAIREELDRIARDRNSAAGDPYVMAQYLRGECVEYSFLEKGSTNDIKRAIEAGYQIITHGWFTSYGHVVGISEWGHVNDSGDWVFREPDPTTGWVYFRGEDPWYEYDFPAGRFTRRTGNNAPYSAYGIFAYCVASWSYHGAREIYARGQLNSSQGGGWLHLIKN
jgi:hypothetical protein